MAPGLQSPAEIEAHTYRGVALDLSATLNSDTLPREAVSGDVAHRLRRGPPALGRQLRALRHRPSPGEKQLLPDNGGPAVQHQRLRQEHGARCRMATADTSPARGESSPPRPERYTMTARLHVIGREDMPSPRPPGPRPHTPRWPYVAAFAVILAAGAALRFWQLARSGWQYDEIVYWQVADSILHGGGLTEHVTYGAHWTPFLYQPPWYSYALSGWFTVFGSTIYHARVLGVLCSVGTLFLAWRLVARLHGPQAAVFVLVPVAFDGWLLYIQRMSYIENVVLLAVTAAFLLYQRATDAPGWQRFAAAGVVLGAAGCLKYTGYVRGGCDGAVLADSAAAARRACGAPGHRGRGDRRRSGRSHCLVRAFLVSQQTPLQGRRVLGLQPSGGSLTSPGQLAHLLAAQYRVFAPSLLVAIAGMVIAVRRLLGCYRDRDWRALRPQAVLFSWGAVAVLIVGFSNLRYPQYFALVLLPLYLLWWTEVWGWDRPLKLKLALAGASALAGVISFGLSTTAQSGNPLAQVRQYAARYIPAKAVVVADEMTGDLLAQPYCREQAAAPCLDHASYAITWTTYLQSTSRLGGRSIPGRNARCGSRRILDRVQRHRHGVEAAHRALRRCRRGSRQRLSRTGCQPVRAAGHGVHQPQPGRAGRRNSLGPLFSRQAFPTRCPGIAR